MNLKETLKLEAINRTKERCLSNIGYIKTQGLYNRVHDHIWAGKYIQAPEWDATLDYGGGSFVVFNGEKCFASGVNNPPRSIKDLDAFRVGKFS